MVGIGEFTSHFRTCFSGDWDVHWGYGIFSHGQVGVAQTSNRGYAGLSRFFGYAKVPSCVLGF